MTVCDRCYLLQEHQINIHNACRNWHTRMFERINIDDYFSDNRENRRDLRQSTLTLNFVPVNLWRVLLTWHGMSKNYQVKPIFSSITNNYFTPFHNAFVLFTFLRCIFHLTFCIVSGFFILSLHFLLSTIQHSLYYWKNTPSPKST